jgi:hypothetical protein
MMRSPIVKSATVVCAPLLLQISLAPLLSRLGPKTLLVLYTAMICERRILFVSQHLSVLSSCVHAAMSLLFPFEWPVRTLLMHPTC